MEEAVRRDGIEGGVAVGRLRGVACDPDLRGAQEGCEIRFVGSCIWWHSRERKKYGAKEGSSKHISTQRRVVMEGKR